MNRYTRLYQEAFEKKDMNKALKLMVKVLSNRLGEQIKMSEYPNEFTRTDGVYEGFRGIFGDKGIRFNFKLGNTSGKLSSIDVWNSPKVNPDFTIDVSEVNVVKAIDQIVQAIKEGKPQEIDVMQEKTDPSTKGKLSKAISDSISAWSQKMDINDEKLRTSRITHLYKDYLFWYQEFGEEEGHKEAKQGSFTNYVQKYMEKFGIENIFSRSIKVKKAGKDKLKVDSVANQKFNSSIYEMDLDDLIEQIRMATVSVIKGHKTARLISGTAGIGKTKAVEETLKDKGYSPAGKKLSPGSKQYKLISGDIKNPRALYQLLTDWNDPNLVLVFDDTNSILKNKANVEILRKATENQKVRTISYSDNKINSENKKYPPELDFKSKIVVITNIPKKKIDSAIVSRTSPVEIDASFDDIADSIRRNLKDIPPPGAQKEKEEVLDFIVYDARKEINKIDYRLFMDSLLWRLTGSPKWKKFVFALLKEV